MKKLLLLTCIISMFGILSACQQKCNTNCKIENTSTTTATTNKEELDFYILPFHMKKRFNLGEEFTDDDLIVYVIYTDFTEENITTNYTIDSSNYKKDVIGSYEIYVNYKEFQRKSFKVDVIEPEELTITGLHVRIGKNEFDIDEPFTEEGIKVSLSYSDGSTKVITEGYTVDSSEFKNEVGYYGIKVNYGEIGITYHVTVGCKIEMIGIEVISYYVKKEYSIGEELDLCGLFVFEKMNYGPSTQTFNYTIDSSNYNKNVAGIYKIIVKREGYDNQEFNVTVKEQ